MVKYKSLFAPGETVDTFGGGLTAKFGMPPFSVLDARSGEWQSRKAAWLAIGIKSELGRGENLLRFSDTILEPDAKKRAGKKAAAVVYGSGGPGTLSKELRSRAVGSKDGVNRTPMMGGKPDNPESVIPGWYTKLSKGMTREQIIAEWVAKHRGQTASLTGGLTYGTTTDPYRAIRKAATVHNDKDWVRQKIADGDLAGGLAANQSGTSIFDPVLCEMFYRWFVPKGGVVLDPFSGGSVRGIVAARLGLRYTGFDLRQEQVDANKAQRNLCTPGRSDWICDDSRNLTKHIKPGSADAVFSCPPYVDLERYSDDPRDLSTLGYAEFMEAYEDIISRCAKALKPNSFAAFVVGEVRGKDGSCLGFVPGTTTAFMKAGMSLYNDAVLLTSIGSLPIRMDRQFSISRKLGRCHQYFLIYVKGDPKKAVAAINGSAEE